MPSEVIWRALCLIFLFSSVSALRRAVALLRGEFIKARPEFDDCPQACANGDETRKPFQFCDDCPVKCEKDTFRDLTLNALTEKFPEGNHPKIETLAENLNLLFDLQDLPREKQSVKTANLLKILNAERNNKKRIERFNEKESD
jgi:hypothetical protein